MLSRLSKRSPVILRVFLTAVSALSAVVFASAFTLAPSSPSGPSLAASPARQASNAYDAQAAEAVSAEHLWHAAHVAHMSHMSHLAALAAQEQQAREAASAPVPAVTPAPSSQAVTVSGTFSGSGVQACIIARESGGNSQVVNASGHYGLYQFSYSTWVGSGGNGADFGHASVAEQNQVFANAVAARGYSDWTPYDGCGA